MWFTSGVPLLEDRSCPVPCLFPLAHAPIMEGIIYGLTSRGRQRVESEEAAHVCPQRPHGLFSLTKASQPQMDHNTRPPNGMYRDYWLLVVSIKTQKEFRSLKAPGHL